MKTAPTLRVVSNSDAQAELGESGVIPVAAAVANAVKDAVGVRITELPLRPERVHRALAARGPGKE